MKQIDKINKKNSDDDTRCSHVEGVKHGSGILCSFDRIWTLFIARNKEFYRDRAAFLWNILFPFLIIVGFGFMFSNDGNGEYKIGYLVSDTAVIESNATAKTFLSTRHLDFVRFHDFNDAIEKLRHHKIDMVVDFDSSHYWMSESSPKGYIAEKILAASGVTSMPFVKVHFERKEIPYVAWLFPGILAMNIMFSALFGVGFVVVRYRKNGALKRMSVTPIHPWEFLTAQVISRLFVIIVTTMLVYAGCSAIYKFECAGSYLLLLLVFVLGTFCLISLGLLVASRIDSEEFAGGIVNVLSWPMMFMSEVWFSLEGAHPVVKKLSVIFPLTHMIDAARKVMNDGAGIAEIKVQLLMLAAMSVIFITAGSLLFKWQKD